MLGDVRSRSPQLEVFAHGGFLHALLAREEIYAQVRTACLVHALDELIHSLNLCLVLGMVALDACCRGVELEGQKHSVCGLVETQARCGAGGMILVTIMCTGMGRLSAVSTIRTHVGTGLARRCQYCENTQRVCTKLTSPTNTTSGS